MNPVNGEQGPHGERKTPAFLASFRTGLRSTFTISIKRITFKIQPYLHGGIFPLITSRGKHETGMSRLALSDADKQARDWFVYTAQSLACHVDGKAIF